MYKIDAAALHVATTILANLTTLVSGRPALPQAAPMGRSAGESVEMLARLRQALAPISVPVTKMTIEDAQEVLRTNRTVTYFECGQLLLSISHNLERELKLSKLFSLDPRRAECYEPPEPIFGAEVQMKFPSIADELDQAGKCYACDLPTAAAFHWIRCLEAAIRAIARCLGISDPTTGAQRNWSNLAKEIKASLDKKFPSSADKLKDDYRSLDRMFASLSAMTNPYRNETMHLDGSYTAAGVLHLSELVKGILVQVSSRMDELGEPKLP